MLKNDYTDTNDKIAPAYHQAKKEAQFAPLPPELLPYAEQVFSLIDTVFSDAQLPPIENGRDAKTNELNDNFDKQEFKALWSRINHKAVYTVDFKTDELISKCVAAIDKELRVSVLQYTVGHVVQKADVTYDELKQGDAFKLVKTNTEDNSVSSHSAVKYDLIGKLSESTQLTRRTIAEILSGINNAVFSQFKTNPEDFIAKAARLINEQKATVIVEHLTYDTVADKHELDIFTLEKQKIDLTKAGDKLKRHIYDYVVTDSKVERDFVTELDTSAEVVVYAKLPKGFFIPTPVGNYNPDWAIAFKEGTVKHIYFVAETKGSLSSMELRAIEHSKIACARKFFTRLNQTIAPENVQYSVVDSYGKLMELVNC